MTELETFGTCSALWFVERQLKPRDVEQPLDARVGGSVMHNALRLFFRGVPVELRVARLRPEHLPAAFALLDRCIDEAIATQAKEDDDVAWEALRRELRRNLRTVVRTEAERLDEFMPRHMEISLPDRGVRVGDVAITGRIDRVDERDWVAEALIWDYKSGQVGPLGANVLERGRLQMPLYIRAVSEFLGRDVVGGLYQSVKGDEAPRGVLRARRARRGRARGLLGPRLRGARGLREPGRRGRRAGAARRPRACGVGDVRARSARRRVPAVVQVARRLPGGEPMSAVAPQRAAAGRRRRARRGRRRRRARARARRRS